MFTIYRPGNKAIIHSPIHKHLPGYEILHTAIVWEIYSYRLPIPFCPFSL